MRLDQLPPTARAQAEAQLTPRRVNHPGFPESSPPPKPRSRRAVADGITFASQTESRVYVRLRDECAASGLRLVLQPRMPAWSLGTNEYGRPLYVTPDFAILDGITLVRIVDAKPKNKKAHSRDWNRGRRALESSYGIPVEECDR
jgi:hypothetical protein